VLIALVLIVDYLKAVSVSDLGCSDQTALKIACSDSFAW